MARCYFIYGLSGAGKSTIAKELYNRIDAEWIDGDQIRGTPLVENASDYSKIARDNHILKIGYIASMFVNRNINVIVSCIAPYKGAREEIKRYFKPSEFLEIYVNTPLAVCEARDVKGLYKKARNGEIKGFTGIDDPFEDPDNPDIVINTAVQSVQIVIAKILNHDDRFIKPTSLFIGRFQPPHMGHIKIINDRLKTHRVIIGIKFSTTDNKNIYIPMKIKKAFDNYYKDNRNIEVQIMPGFSDIQYGRNVGYDMQEVSLPEEYTYISATDIRKLLEQNHKSKPWRHFMPKEIAEIIECR